MSVTSDLDSCAREPIHVPGYIQPFGVLLAMRSGTTMISQASLNTAQVFSVEPAQILGRELELVLNPAAAKKIRTAFEEGSWKDVNPIKATLTLEEKPLPCNLIIHRYDGLDFVEIETIKEEGADIALRSYQTIQSALARLQKSTNIPELCSAVVAEVSRITGYDRVMVYKFDRDDHGFVTAEKKLEHHTSFLGLHYPASDIPDQARRLYRSNWVRYIPDIEYKPVELIPIVDREHERLTDMTHCVLRSVSPVHCEYLRNMKVAASMSVSIMRGNRLWGLIACHNDTPRELPYEMRSACEILGQVLSIRIAALEESEDCAYKSNTNELQAKFLANLAGANNIPEALLGPSLSLLDFIPSTGAVVSFQDKLLKVGRTPEDGLIRRVVKNIVKRMRSPIFASDRLQDRLPEAREFTDTASGALCFTVSRAHDFHVMWFRAEQVQEVSWGGDPNKPAEQVGSTERLSPRKSFEVWKQEVRGKSKAWTQPEIDASAELRSTLMSLMLRLDEDALSSLSGQLIAAQEEERRRVAREIHDDYQQRLAILAVDLNGLLSGDHSEETRQGLCQIQNEVSELASDLHSLSHRMHSSTLELLGLVAGLSAFCKEFQNQQGLEIEFIHDDVPQDLPFDAALCMFRVAQESLRNVKKHSGANRAEVRLEMKEGELHLSVSDSGTGLNPNAPSPLAGIGIRSMQERLRLVGGYLELHSRASEGTTLSARIPFKSPSQVA